MVERFLHTFDDWMVRVNRRLTRLERRLPFSGGSSTVPDPLVVNQLQVTGTAVVPDPVLDEEAANKGYVDTAVEGATQHLVAGAGVTVTGTGTAADPWVVSATGTSAPTVHAAGARFATAVQSIPTGAWTGAVFGAVQNQTGGVAASNGGLGVPAAGWYTVTASWQWDANATGFRAIEIYLNNASVNTGVLASDRRVASGASSNAVSISVLTYLAVDDFVKLRVFQNTGAALSSNLTGANIHLAVASVAAVA